MTSELPNAFAFTGKWFAISWSLFTLTKFELIQMLANAKFVACREWMELNEVMVRRKRVCNCRRLSSVLNRALCLCYSLLWLHCELSVQKPHGFYRSRGRQSIVLFQLYPHSKNLLISWQLNTKFVKIAQQTDPPKYREPITEEFDDHIIWEQSRRRNRIDLRLLNAVLVAVNEKL